MQNEYRYARAVCMPVLLLQNVGKWVLLNGLLWSIFIHKNLAAAILVTENILVNFQSWHPYSRHFKNVTQWIIIKRAF